MGLGTFEIVIVCGVIVLLFGAGAIPKFARSIGKARKEFEKGTNEVPEDEEHGQIKSGAPNDSVS